MCDNAAMQETEAPKNRRKTRANGATGGPVLVDLTAPSEQPGAERQENDSPPIENIPSPVETATSETAFPKPPGFKEKYPVKLSPEALFAYWSSIPIELRNKRCICYMYRRFPMCDVLQPLPLEQLRSIELKKERKPVTYIVKLTEPVEPAKWNEWLCDQFGAGEYAFTLNDTHPSVKCTIAHAETNGEGTLRDWDRYPPVLKIAEVVLTEKKNEPYIRWAHLRGIRFPNEPGYEDTLDAPENGEKEEEMMTVNTKLMEQNENLVNRLVDAAEKKTAAGPVVVPDAGKTGDMGAVETVVQGSKRALDIMGNAMERAAKSAADQSDPAKILSMVGDVVKMVTGGNGSGKDPMVEMMRMQMELQDKNFARLLEMERSHHASEVTHYKETLTQLNERLSKIEAGGSSGNSRSEESTIDKLISLKHKLEEFADEAATDNGPAWLEPALNFGEKIITNIGSALHNLAVLRTGQGQPAPPPEVAPQIAAPEVVKPREPTQEEKDMQVELTYAKMIHEPLLSAMKLQTPGHEFAAVIINEAGMNAYDYLVQKGKDGLIHMLKSHPPLWNDLMQPSIGGAAVDRFLDQFLNRDEALKLAEILKRGKMPESGRVTQAPPAVPQRGPRVNPAPPTQ